MMSTSSFTSNVITSFIANISRAVVAKPTDASTGTLPLR